ncbi:hypothetical protein NMY22_g9667 [Coprinellus aureogranulatus]|nr:hypothetical protein NMY22_g9667 [Coprinellus aureogranulatus]
MELDPDFKFSSDLVAQILGFLDPVDILAYCDGRLVMCCRSSGHELVAMSLPIPTENSTWEIQQWSALLVEGYIGNEYDGNRVGFCPMSGRVVHIATNTTIQVTDFLLPLPETSHPPSMYRITSLPDSRRVSPRETLIVLRPINAFDGVAEPPGGRGTPKYYYGGNVFRTNQEDPHYTPKAALIAQFDPIAKLEAIAPGGQCDGRRLKLATCPRWNCTLNRRCANDALHCHWFCHLTINVLSLLSQMNRNTDFLLPPDILGLIMQELDPVDILAMRAACRMFYKTAATRSVWISSLHRVCDQHGTYNPTYPTDKMTLAELEHAASGPHRFVKLVNEFGSAPTRRTQPYMTRRIACRMNDPVTGPQASDGLHWISAISLVPGGRFLVSAGRDDRKEDDPGAICLWDLGHGPNSVLDVFPVSSAALRAVGSPLVQRLEVSPCMQGRNTVLRVLLQCLLYQNQNYFAVYEINPTSAHPGFVLLAELQDPSPSRSSVCRLHLSGPTVVIPSQHGVCVWNWDEGTGCYWYYDDPMRGWNACIYDQTIIAVDLNQDFIVWDIPEKLPPLTPNGALPIVSNRGKRIRRRREDILDPSISIATTSIWQRDSQAHLCLMIDEEQLASVRPDFDDGLGFEPRYPLVLYSVRRSGIGPDATFFPTYIPVEGYKSESISGKSGDPSSYFVSPLSLCDNRLVVASRSERNELFAIVLPVPTEASDTEIDLPSARLTVAEEDDEQLDDHNTGFCPMSGRVARMVNPTTLEVSDFLAPFEAR